MRRLSLCVFLFIMSIAFAVTDSVADGPKRYPEVKSGIIKYNIAGMHKGTEVVYFDDWGNVEAKYIHITFKMMGVTKETNSLTLITDGGKWIYNIDLHKRTGTKMKNPMFDKFAEKADEEMTNFGEEVLKEIGAVKTGTEEVAGKICDVWESSKVNMKTSIWKGIALKTETGSGKMKMSTVATEVQDGVPVPKEKLEVPSDVRILTVDTSKMRGGPKPD